VPVTSQTTSTQNSGKQWKVSMERSATKEVHLLRQTRSPRRNLRNFSPVAEQLALLGDLSTFETLSIGSGRLWRKEGDGCLTVNITPIDESGHPIRFIMPCVPEASNLRGLILRMFRLLVVQKAAHPMLPPSPSESSGPSGGVITHSPVDSILSFFTCHACVDRI